MERLVSCPWLGFSYDQSKARVIVMHLRQKFSVVHFCLVGCFFTLEKAQFLAHLDPLDGRWSLWGKCKIHAIPNNVIFLWEEKIPKGKGTQKQACGSI